MSPRAQNLPWTESPFFEHELHASDLSEEDKAFINGFAENGYAIFNPQLDESLIDALNNSMAPHFGKIAGEDKRIQDAWTYNDHVRKVAVSDTVLDKLRLLYRREPIPFQTLNFPVGTQQKTHSDMVHFNSIPQRFMCGVWVALEDISNDNGPLHYYPQSHKLPFYDMIDLGVKASDNIETKKAIMAYAVDYTNFIQEIIQALALKKQTLTIKKGQAMIWSANLLHGGERINTPGATRHSQVTHYYFEDCIYYVPRLSDIAINKLYLNHLVNIRTGKKVVNTYFGKEVKPATRLVLQQSTVKMLSKITHLFPKEVVAKIKSIIVR
ncbi:MAG TPA: phytanoyl-CoA dioxygenase family protein [Puia sp.]|nr:phytanoyl-CoA dioxygenase family protein [Puia sp.]